MVRRVSTRHFPKAGKVAAHRRAPTGLRALNSSLKPISIFRNEREATSFLGSPGRPRNLSPHDADAGDSNNHRSTRARTTLGGPVLTQPSTNLVVLRMPYILFLKTRHTAASDASWGLHCPRTQEIFLFCRVGYSVRVGFGHRERSKSRGVSVAPRGPERRGRGCSLPVRVRYFAVSAAPSQPQLTCVPASA
jgi:hypothetical protein